MAKFSRFDETKINLVMVLQKVSREEAIATLKLTRKGCRGGLRPCEEKNTVSATGFSRRPEMMSAKEFFSEN